MSENAGKNKIASILVPVGLLVGMAAGYAHADAHEKYVTSSSGTGVTTGYGECWQGVGGSEAGNCGAMDSDGDGVIDANDRCPGTPKGVVVDPDGCPKDSDGDGVPDYMDKCPGTPAGAKVDADGCEITGDAVINTTADHFDFDSAVLKPKMKEELDAIVNNVKASKGNEMLEVVGHTDSTGPEAYNQGLSERRAQSAAEYMVEQGLDGSRITVKGMGESAPVADNGTREGRAMNRRVEVMTK